MISKIKNTLYGVYKPISDRYRDICRSGALGRKRQIRAYIGKPEPGAERKTDQWDEFIEGIISEYKGIRVWENAVAGRIGEYLVRFRQLALYAKELDDGYLNVEYDSNYDKGNNALTTIMDRTIPVIFRGNRAKWDYVLNRVPSVDWSHFGPIEKDGSNLYLFKDCKDLLALTEEETLICQKRMRDMDLTEPYVCFSSRDSRYLKTLLPWKNNSYHDYRDSSIENKALMIDYLASKGIRSVRMGKDMDHRFVHNGSIDFSFDHYDDLMDIYLHEHAKFVVEDMNGLIEIPMTNNGNIVVTNLTPLSDDWSAEVRPQNGIAIFKKEYSHRLGRLLSLDEMLEAEAVARYNGRKYDEMGIEMIENTPEEILDATIEMNERMDGIWVETEEDIELQKAFDDFKKRMMKKLDYTELQVFSVKVGTMFLKKNKDTFGI